MNKDFYLNKVDDLSADEIVQSIRNNIVAFSELQSTGNFSNSKQKQVKDLLKKFQEEDDAFKNADTIKKLKEFLNRYPNSDYSEKAKNKIRELTKKEEEEREREIQYIKDNINKYRPDEVLKELGEESLKDLCKELDLDYNVVLNFDEPTLTFNDIPKSSDEIPTGFTDVFFWGIPSSGKTTALSAIFRTMRDKYTITSPSIPTKFGSTYRDSLTNIYSNGTAYLPPATQRDRTQYMPFLLKRRDEKKYRNVSFFELSGEVFKYFYEKEHNVSVIDEYDRGDVESAFRTLDLLLKSDNQKIHFFFIDYRQERNGKNERSHLTQENYLDAAATYFRDNNNIFKRKTDAVYIVLTKADEIVAENKVEYAKDFLAQNFGSFMDVMKTRCQTDSVNFSVKIFSIGNVYFKAICKLDYRYSESIINDLLNRIKPPCDTILGRFLRS